VRATRASRVLDIPGMAARLERFAEIGREIETRGVGRARAAGVAARIGKRLGHAGPWYEVLDRPKDAQEATEIEKSVAEWADGDSIAAHIAYGNDFFCTEDQGKTAGNASVLDLNNRTWLETCYGVQFVTLSELAGKLQL
jgi:hypothetical protein